MGNITKLFLLITVFLNGAIFAGDEIVVKEVALTKVYVPAVGFDDNDNIEIVTEGHLPNPCYSVGKAVAGPVINNTVTIRQFAWKKTDGPCAQEIDDPVPFIAVASLEHVKMGDYQVQFMRKNGEIGKRSLNVASAGSKGIDNFSYAAVRSLDIKEISFEGEEVFATINGNWTTRCQRLEDPVKIERQNDLFLILPILIPDSEPKCEKNLAPFSVKVSLGTLELGTYLLHSRSRGGQAIYRPFQVWPHLK